MPVTVKKKRIIIIAAIALVLGLIAASVYTVMQYNRANEVGTTYIKKTVDHLNAIGEAPDSKPQERIDIFRNKVTLEDVAFGSLLSAEYRKAEEAKAKYTAFLDKSMPFFEQNYTLAVLTPILQEFIASVKTTIPAGATANEQADIVDDRAKKLDEIAGKLDGLYFNDEHKNLKTTAVDNIRKMSKASRDSADLIRKGENSSTIRGTLQQEYSKSYENVSEAIRKMPPYGVEIVEYLNKTKPTLDGPFKAYIDEYKTAN